MPITKTNTMFERITGAKCDCCDEEMKVDRYTGELPEHMILSGSSGRRNLESIICKKCVDEKLSFIKINSYENRIGYC